MIVTMSETLQLPQWSPVLPQHRRVTPCPPVDWPWVPGVDADAHTLAAMAQDGLLRPFTEHTYLAVDVAPSRAARVAAIAEHVPHNAVVRGNTAAWLLGAQDTWCDPVQLYLPTRCAARTNKHYQYAVVPSEDQLIIHGVAVTSELRTAVDLAKNPAGVGSLRDLAYLLTEKVTSEQVLARLRCEQNSTATQAAMSRLESWSEAFMAGGSS